MRSSSAAALKDIAELPKHVVPRVTKVIDALRSDPRPPGCKKLKGQHEDLWRIRVGDYRVIYDIMDKVRVVEVREVGDRKTSTDRQERFESAERGGLAGSGGPGEAGARLNRTRPTRPPGPLV